MDQQGISPIARAGVLPNNDYADYPSPQDLFNAFAAYLEVSVEAGKTGATGSSGQDATANIKYFGMIKEQEIAIPDGVTSVNTGIDLEEKIVQIRAPQGHGTTTEENFSVGVVEGQVVHLVFQDQVDTFVARTGWVLEVWGIGEVPAP